MNIFDQLKTLEPLQIREIEKNDIFMHVFKKEGFVLVTVNVCTERDGKIIKIQTVSTLHTSKAGYVPSSDSYTYNRKNYYPDHEFFKICKDISPEFFL